MVENDMGKKIKNLRIYHGLTLEQVANQVGVGKSTVRKWETGMIANMRRDKIASLAKALHTTPAYLMGWDDDSQTHNSKHGVQIPVLGQVAAGIPIDAIEDIIDYDEIPAEWTKTGEYFGLKIKGDSMSPRILNGDVVIVRKQSSCDNGDIAVILVNGENATVKKVQISNSGIMLIPLNPTYEPKFFDQQAVLDLPVTIIGKVVELRGKF